MATPPALLFYCPHWVNEDQLVRSWALADSLSATFRTVYVAGAPLPRGIRSPSCVQIVTLPVLELGEDGSLLAKEDGVSIVAIQKRRARMLLDTYFLTDPAVVVVERFPFACAIFANELRPMLEYAAAALRRPIVICSPFETAHEAPDRREPDLAQRLVDTYIEASVNARQHPSRARLRMDGV